MLDVLITDSRPTSLCVFFWNSCNVGESLDSLVFRFVCGYTTEIDIRRTLSVCDFWMRSTIRLVYRVSRYGLILIPEFRLGTELQNISMRCTLSFGLGGVIVLRGQLCSDLTAALTRKLCVWCPRS